MLLKKIFRKDRKTEPTSVFSLRLIVATLLVIILVGYAIFLILDIYNDHPAIQSSFIETGSLPVPVLMFSNIPQKSYLNCYFTYAANSTREDNKACAQYIEQSALSSTLKYEGYFKTSGNLFFSTSSNEGLKNIGFIIYADNATYNTSDPSMSIDLLAIDSELYNIYGSKLFETQNSMFLDSSYNIQVTRSIKYLMSRSWKNYFGFAPDLERIPYVTSTIESSLISNTTGPLTLFSTINIEPQSFIVQVDTDQSYHVSNSLGLFGGAFGLITSFYALLFGAGTIKPWGFVQKHLFKVNRIVQDKLIITLESMPFISHLTQDTNDLKDDLSTEQLEKRLDLLQLFLRDYVVNVQYLEQIQQSNTDCNSYITEPSDINGSYYNGYFSIPFENKYKLILNSPNNTKNGEHDERSIMFELSFMDEIVYQNTSSHFFVTVSDSENVYLKETISSIFLQSITQTNTYQILTGQAVSLYFGRSIRKIIIPNWKAIMGFQPDYDIKPYLTSRKGDDAIQPFGLIQRHGYFYEKTQKKFTKFLSTFPLVQLSDPPNNIDDKNRVEQLEKKIDELELFLRDYVVEVQHLDKVYKNIK
ncbi:4036_t:CDS:10, partial [Cetraspora pellucida]